MQYSIEYDSFAGDFSRHIVKRIFFLVVCLGLLYSKRLKTPYWFGNSIKYDSFDRDFSHHIVNRIFLLLVCLGHIVLKKAKNSIEVWYFY